MKNIKNGTAQGPVRRRRKKNNENPHLHQTLDAAGRRLRKEKKDPQNNDA